MVGFRVRPYRPSGISLTIAGWGMILVIGYVDILTGYHLAFSVFYLIPIYVVSSRGRLWLAITTALMCACMWIAADIIARKGDLDLYVAIWNFCIRLGVFLFAAVILNRDIVSRKKQDELVEFIIHDLRNSALIIAEGVKLLKDSPDAKKAQLIDVVMISCRRLKTLIDSIIDLSRLKSDNMPVSMNVVRITDLFKRGIDEVSVYAERSQVAININCHDDNMVVRTDPEILHRVLINLVSNAIKMSPPGSGITLNSFLGQEKGSIRLSVRDEGPGIPPDMLKKVFGKFTQAGTKGSSVSLGSGIGLNFCQLAVKTLGGRIWLESAEGKGTEVFLEFRQS